MTNRYTYTGPLNGGYAIQDKAITWELRDFCMSTYEWQEFFAADGVTDHREKFIERFGRWIRSSELNTIDGLLTVLVKHSVCLCKDIAIGTLSFIKATL